MQALKSRHKVLALLLAVILMIGMMPVVTSAAEDDANSFIESFAATPGTTTDALYNPDDIAVINNVINTNWTEDAYTFEGKTSTDPSGEIIITITATKIAGHIPSLADNDGSSVPSDWDFVTWSDDSINKRITELDFRSRGLVGSMDLRGLPSLIFVNFGFNYLDGADVTGCHPDFIGTAVFSNFSGGSLIGGTLGMAGPRVGEPPTGNPTPTPPPTYPSGSGNSSSSGGSSSSSSVSTGPVNVTSDAATTAVNSALTEAKAAGASTATANIKNPGDISLSTLKAMANQAGATPLKLQADSMSEDGRSVDVRITLDPKLATGNLNLFASTTNAAAKAAETIFEKFFSNNVSVISLGQRGSFGQPVEIAAKIDPALDTDNLVFYSYDKATNSYRQIKNPSYWVDKNGYVHFTTTLGGNIIISDGALAKR